MAYKDFYDLDYTSIKTRLKIFLKEQTDLTDYNFEGSGISNWLNIMSYVISYIGAVLNFVANEMFISTAQKESNILKLAYQLNYLPRRKSAPYIKLRFTNTHTSQISIPLYTQIQMGEINLVVLEDKNGNKSDIVLEAGEVADVKVYEGVWIKQLNVISEIDDYEIIKLDNKTSVDWEKFYIDITHEDPVNVFTTTQWNSVYKDNNYTGAKNFFIRYFDDFQVVFDKKNGMFEKPSVGDVVTITYLNTNGARYNGYSYASQLLFTDSFLNSDLITIGLNNQILQDGLDEESFESIAKNAPLFYSASGRAVTEKDYNIKIQALPLYQFMADMFVYSSHKDYVDREYENPNEYLTNASKRDLGYYIFGGIRRDTTTSFENRYTLMTMEDIQKVKDFFKPYKYMQTFGKYKISHVWYLRFKIDVKLITDINVEKDDFKNSLNNELEKIVGYDNTFNLTHFISYVQSFKYVDYCRVDYKNIVRVFKPRIRISIDSNIEQFNVGDIILGVISNVSAKVVRIDASKDSITVERLSVSNGMFSDSETIKISGTTTTAIIQNLYKSVVVRLNDGLKPQSVYSSDTNGIFDDGIGNIKNGSTIIGTVNYETGYLQFEYDFDDVFIELLFETKNYEKIDARLDMFLDYEPIENNEIYHEYGINYI